MLTIFYDGHCPLCLTEMKALKKLDHHNHLQLEDIHSETFNLRFPHVDPIEADKILHGQLNDGNVIFGLDVTCLAWKLVNKHKWIQALRWPVIKPIADLGYRFFARYRHSIARFATNKHACNMCKK